MNRNALMLTLATIAALALSAGCENNAKYFEPNDAYRLHAQHADVAAANGARADGTLYPRHFAGDKLSSLGQTKLQLIATASKSDTGPVNIYFDMPEAAMTDARKDVVKAFLDDQGVADDRLTLAAGPNPGAKELATVTADKMYKSSESGIGAPAAASDYGKPKETGN
jgi:hypothetical protein